MSPSEDSGGTADMSDEITAFIRARLDETAEVAERWSADEREWQNVGDRKLRYANGSYEYVTAVDVSGNPNLWWERIHVTGRNSGLADHLVRHDPAAVLRWVSAVRAVIANLEAQIDGIYGEPQRVDPDLAESLLRLLASPFADHPDYKPEWEPL